MHDSQDGSFFGKINRRRPGSPLASLLTALTRKARNPEQRCPVSLCSRGAGFFRAIHYIPSVMEVETAPTTKGRPREFCGDKALVDALHIFWDKGYDRAPMTQLTEAMGTPNPSLYSPLPTQATPLQKATSEPKRR